jgi:hypothetical protein
MDVLLERPGYSGSVITLSVITFCWKPGIPIEPGMAPRATPPRASSKCRSGNKTCRDTFTKIASIYVACCFCCVQKNSLAFTAFTVFYRSVKEHLLHIFWHILASKTASTKQACCPTRSTASKTGKCCRTWIFTLRKGVPTSG